MVIINKNDEFGRLLYYSKNEKESQDPYKGYKIVHKLGTEECEGTIRFRVPEDKCSIQLDRCMFLCALEAPENYVPDNDFHAKMIKSLRISIMDNKIFDSYCDQECAFFSKIMTKLNFSSDAQEVEMFPEGRYDSRDVDGAELGYKRVKHDGKLLKAHRQKYAEEIWKPAGTIAICNDLTAKPYEELSFRYHIRTPIKHGICQQKRAMPSGSRLLFEIKLNKQSACLLQQSDFVKCRMKKKDMDTFQNNVNFHKDVLLVKTVEEHRLAKDCSCARYIAAGLELEYEQIKDGNYDEIDSSNKAQVLAMTSLDMNEDGKTYKTWQKHKCIYKIIKVSQETVDNEEYVYFWKKKSLDPEDWPKITNHLIETVYCRAGEGERPIQSKGNKNIDRSFTMKSSR